MKKKGLVVVTIVVLLALASAVLAQVNISGSGWWSAIQVQRTGTRAGSATVQMTAYAKQGDAGGPWDCGSRTLASFGSGATFYPHWSTDPAGNNCANASGFPANYQGSCVLSADDEIVAIVQTQNISFGGWAPGDTPYGRAVGAYGGVGVPSTEIKFPVYKNEHNGELTTFFIQNAGSSNANIQAIFRPCADDGTGTPCLGYPNVYTYTFSGLEPNKMIVVDATLAGVPAGNGSFGGLSVSSTNDQPLAGVVFEDYKDASPATYTKVTRGFGTGDYDTTFYAPAVKYQYPDGSGATSPNKSKWSGLVVHNADTVQVTVNITYTLVARNGNPAHPDVGNKYYHNAVLDPGESAFFLFHTGLNPAPGTQERDLLSAEIGATGNIVAVVNEEGDYAIAGTRDYALYSAMPKRSAANRFSAPAYKEQYNGKFHGVVTMNVGDSAAVFTATLTVVGRGVGYTGVMNAGDSVRIKTSSPVPPGGSVTFFMVCQDYFNQFTDLTGDTHQMADLCSGPAGAPTGGVNTGLIVESSQPIVVLANEEVLWYVNPANVGDGYGEDASNYEGFPLQ
jgi:hypothetical protein